MLTRALVVDDEMIMRELIESILVSDGYRVKLASGGGQAIEMLGQETFDVVITDLEMGSISGIDVIRTSKMLDRSRIVIVITGNNDVLNVIRAFRSGADDYILKPFTAKHLLKRVYLQTEKYASRLVTHWD
ncbi:response regulator [Desulfosediminicola flagellatus]|uniref:response regulator n=1 Tax=Desulfosediminicola flagellatus TaxID=2569541 RepID=UPI0010AD3C68|nr:response regulator [Desulfosediminicola flagellatus]